MLCFLQQSYSQIYTINGYVEDSNTGERVIGAYVIDSISQTISQTNNYGYYNFKVKGTKAVLHASYIGLKSDIIHLKLDHDTIVNFKIQSVQELSEVIVTSSLYKRDVNAQLGTVTVPVKQLLSVPALGESDLIKSIQIQPGVNGGIEGSTGIFVRGGSAGENLFMLDDVPIYNVSHLFGFFSAFNSSAIKDIKLIKGCFPARYGGRVSSVVDVRSLDGNNKSLRAELSVGIISSKLTLDGPIFNEKTTFIISGRRSYFNLYSGALENLQVLDQDFPGYYFYDLNTRITHTFSQKDKVFLSFYSGKDKIQNKNGTSFTNLIYEKLSDERSEISGWGNLIGSLRWNHIFGQNLFANTTVALSNYDYYVFTQNNLTQSDSLLGISENNYTAKYSSDISDFIVKTDFDYSLFNNHKILFGAGNTIHTFNPGKNEYSIIDTRLNEKADTSYQNEILHNSEPFLYIQDEIIVTPKISINTGIRLSGLIRQGKFNFNAEPRFLANYSFTPKFVIKTGYSRMAQYIHLLSTSGVSLPTDIWIPALKGLKPLISDQINAGVSFELGRKSVISIELYRKWLKNTTDLRNGASLFTDPSPWYDKTTQGYGDSKGIEISLENQLGHFRGSINYTLSASNRHYSDLNNGQKFPFKYDRLHDLNISVNYQLSKKWDISALWVYGTGFPVTIPVEKYSPALNTGLNLIYYFPSLNNYRLAPYHRLDFGIHYNSSGRLFTHTISFDVFNAYNRKNPINMYYLLNYSFEYVYLLPVIPSITYTLKFNYK